MPWGFIEVNTGDKRDRVQKAIRSLLGLDIIEQSRAHTHQARVLANREVNKISSGNELEEVVSRLDQIAGEAAQLESEISDAQEQFKAFSKKIAEVEKSIEDALKKGDKKQLQEKQQTVKDHLKQGRH